ncbi:MAG: hypothetical protein MR924_14425 [Prevotella sp.]|nr:hypothetical protein [Prevotella sp.]
MNTHSDIGSELSSILFWDVDKNDIDFDKMLSYRTIEPDTLELLKKLSPNTFPIRKTTAFSSTL